VIRWLRDMFRQRRDPPAEQRIVEARQEHVRVLRKAAAALPGDPAVRAEMLRAERAIRGEAR